MARFLRTRPGRPGTQPGAPSIRGQRLLGASGAVGVLASAVSLYWGFALAPPEAAAGVPALIVIPTTVALLTGAALCSPRPVQGPRVLAVPLIAAAALVLGLAARTVLLPVLLGHPSVFALAHAMGWLVVLTPLIVAAVLLGRLGLRLARGERSTGSF